MKTLLLVLTLGVCTLAVAQAPPPWGDPFSLEKAQAYQCVRAEKPIVLDGKLDDPAWAKAQRIERFVVPSEMDWTTFEMTRPRRARSLTRAWLTWDDKYLYFAAEMEDRDLYCVTEAGHDNPFGADDIIELFIKPSDEKPWYWELHVVPSGGTRDYFYARRGAGGGDRWMKYESGMKAAVSLSGTFDDWTDRDNEWIVEMRVPWSAFERWGGKPKVGDFWRMLVSRYDYSVYLDEGRELSAAAPLPWQNYHLFEYYPYLTFK
jgi:hypothetical protein